MKKKKDILFYLLFFAFILFINTPYGLGTRVFLTKGVTAIKTAIFPPKETGDRIRLSSNKWVLNGLYNATNLNLESLEGEVVFINHWATWCPPCRAEMPSLAKLYSDYNDRVSFLFITNESVKEVEPYLSANNYNFPTYNPGSAIPKEINSSSLPATFILDKSGRVALQEFGAADWNSGSVRNLLDTLLEEE